METPNNFSIIEFQGTDMKLESLKELSKRLKWPLSRLRSLTNNNELLHIRLGGKIMIPVGAIDEYIERKMVKPCQKN